MDKQAYLAVQKQLDFTVRPARLRNQLLQDGGILVLAVALLASRTIWGYAFAQLVLACFYFRAFSVMHEAVHRTLSRNDKVNNWLGVLYGGLCFLPFTTWQSIHQEHHLWVGNIEKDPVMRIVREFPRKSERRKALDTLLWRSWLPYFAFLQEVVFWVVSASIIVKKKSFENRRAELVASVLAPTAAAILVVAGGRLCGHWAALVPSLLIYLAMVEIINFPHHLSLPRLSGPADRLSLWDQYKVSRTCVYSPWFSRLVLLNFNYHAEHHMFPTLPWHQLQRAHELVTQASPEGYEMCLGHEWIRTHRQLSLSAVFAPAKNLEADRSEAA